MKLQNGVLYVQSKEVVIAGVLEKTFHNWKNRTAVYAHKEGVASFVPYSELPDNWQRLLDDYYKPSALKYAQYQTIKSDFVLPDADWQIIRNFSWEANGIIQKLDSIARDGIEQAAMTLHWLVNFDKRGIKKYGVETMDNFWELVASFIDWHKIKVPASSRRLQQKIKEYAQEGAICLISRNYGNSNSSKITKPINVETDTRVPTVGDLAARLMQDDRKFSVKEVARQVKSILDAHNVELGKAKKGITYQAIWQHVTSNAHLWALQREGETAFRKNRELRINARRLSTPHIQWQMDGTLFSVFYKNEQGKIDKLYVVIVMDTCSRAIIGWDISYTENTTAVFNALKMAVKRTGYLPSELRSDKGSAFKSGEVQEMLRQLNITWIPSRPRNPKSRSIESQQNIWLNNIARYYPAYGGANITAQASDASHRSMEAMKNVQLNGLGDKQSLIHCIVESICIHNAHRNDKGESANQRLQQGTSARRIDCTQIMEEFCIWRKKGDNLVKYHLTPEGIEMEVNKMKFRYIPDGTEAEISDFMNKYLSDRRGFYIKYDPSNLESILLYILPRSEKATDVVPEKLRQIDGYSFVLKGQSAQSFRDASSEEIANFQQQMRIKKLQIARASEAGDEIAELLRTTKILERGLTFADVHKEDYNEARREFEGLISAGYADALVIDEYEVLSQKSQQKTGVKPSIFNKNKYLND
jgi:transposase InsO family protein